MQKGASRPSDPSRASQKTNNVWSTCRHAIMMAASHSWQFHEACPFLGDYSIQDCLDFPCSVPRYGLVYSVKILFYSCLAANSSSLVGNVRRCPWSFAWIRVTQNLSFRDRRTLHFDVDEPQPEKHEIRTEYCLIARSKPDNPDTGVPCHVLGAFGQPMCHSTRLKFLIVKWAPNAWMFWWYGVVA